VFCLFAGNCGESRAPVQEYYFQEVLCIAAINIAAINIAAINISHCKIVEEEYNLAELEL
jgi:hypothetical protein